MINHRIARSIFAGLALGTVLTPMAAMAAAPDVTAVVTGINDAITPITAIGGAVLLVLVAVKVYKWVRRAM